MDYIWVAVAFICGYIARQMKLPPLIGYLMAGFALHALGFTADSTLTFLSDLGVTLLLFTIGLKLDLKSLLKNEIWGVASTHMVIIVILTTINSLFFAYLGVAYFIDLNWSGAALIGFAVSFSSTVCAVKILEERGEMNSRHGQVAIGILIIQDIAAVIFVTLSTAKAPSLWALGLLALPLTIPLINKLLKNSGHGELLPLAGFFLALSAGELFELVGLKAQLGALLIAIMISGQPKSAELAKSLLNFKDIFLIGFFLSIGFTAIPTLNMLWVAAIMAVALPIKAGLFFLIMTKLRMRGRSSFLTSLSLANYSEFGLIVCSASVLHGFLAKEWLVIMALMVALSFVFSSIINAYAHRLYSLWRHIIIRFEETNILAEDQLCLPKDVSILIIGMGRVGTGSYDNLQEYHHKKICGIEMVPKLVKSHMEQSRNVICADAQDPVFWEDTNLEPIEMIMFAVPKYLDILEIVKQLQTVNYQGKMAGIAKYEDDREKLLDAGVDLVFNFYKKAGAGFAEQAIQIMEKK